MWLFGSKNSKAEGAAPPQDTDNQALVEDSKANLEVHGSAAATTENAGEEFNSAMGISAGTAGDKGESSLYEGQSVIEQVALTVPVGDDPAMPALTARMFLLGSLSCAVLAFVNQFFYYRTAPLTVSSFVAQLITLYLGRFMHVAVPKHWTWLNPGPFSIKEHVLICIMAGSGAVGVYAVDIVTLTNSPAYYNSYMPLGAAFVICITTQILGYGWAGLFRRYLVDPAHMWWPNSLVTVALFRSMHEKEDSAPGEIGRFKFFLIVAGCSFLYYSLPGYVFTLLTSFAWVCFIWPDSIVAQQIGSGYSGMGIGALCFDWATTTSFLGSPLATPWYVIVNITLGFTLFMWVIQPFVYWYNVYDARMFEFWGSDLFNSDGSPYDVLAVVDPATLTLNETAFEIYGPPNLSVFFAITYGLSFATLTATVVHVVLWNGKDVVKLTKAAWSSSRGIVSDVHARIVKNNYKDIPEWWFLCMDVLSIGLSLMGIFVWHKTLQLPWWGLLFAAALSCSLTLPVGVIAATTNQVPGLNVITEMILGYILPGKPIANVLFKTYGYISCTTAVGFLSDFKLGVYMKIPPRAMFVTQVYSAILAAVVTLLWAWWQINNIANICNVAVLQQTDPNSEWTCPYTHVFFDASVIWGLIGPKNIFGANGKYRAQNWFWIIGAILPIPFWVAYQFFPRQTWLKLVNMPVFLGAGGLSPPAGTINYTSWFVWGFIFEYYTYHYRKRWWARYNYLFSAGMDTGVAFMGLLLFFAFQNRENPLSIDWWGNQLECPIVTCPTNFNASLAYNAAVGGGCPVWS